MVISKFSKTEIGILILIITMLAVGFILVFTNARSFALYVQEDGIVEWLTVLGLLLGAAVCFKRTVHFWKHRSWLFLVVTALMGIVLFFGAGEEISWGQRILGIKSPEYFQQNNLQGETNFHNLMLGDFKVNKWIFSIALTVFLGIYILVIPFLYRTKRWMQNFVTYCGIPLPKAVHIVAFIAIFLLTELIPNGKRAEILEAATALLLFLIIRFPANKKTFDRISASQ